MSSAAKVNPRMPVIIGVSQVACFPKSKTEIANAANALELMVQAVDEALADCGQSNCRSMVDTIAVVGGLWSYHDPAALLAKQCGITPLKTIRSTFGGQIPVQLLAELADRIQANEVDLAVLTCGENNLSRRAQKKLGLVPPRKQKASPQQEAISDNFETFGPPLDMGDDIAIERGAELPRNSYAIFDSALRQRRGETLDEARDRAASLWAGYSAVAVNNPHAADRKGMTANEIRQASTDNRFVSWPYTKAMCANNNVDHAGAIVIASTQTADRLGINSDQRVYPHQCVMAVDTPSLINRYEVATAPGLAAAAAALQNMIGDLNELDHVDLYSCFPSMVALTTEALKISTDRPLTVTGGLDFAGAPLNFAAGESIIGMVRRLRDCPSSVGLVQGNGGHASKHALATYSTTPSAMPYKTKIVVHDAPVRQAADPYSSGSAILDGVTVEYDPSGPFRAIGLVRFANGTRTWATNSDSAIMQSCTEVERVGLEVEVTSGTFSF